MKFPEGGGSIIAGFLMGFLLTPNSKELNTNNIISTLNCTYSQDIQGVKLKYCYKAGSLLDTSYVLSGIQETDGQKVLIKKFNIKGPILVEKKVQN